MEFIEAPAFTKYHPDYFDDDDLKELQQVLQANSEIGDVMPGTGGVRKMRWADSRRGKGKRGGLRIIYFYFFEDAQIWLLSIYDKNEADDLTTEQKRMLKTAIEVEKRTRHSKNIVKIYGKK